MPGLSFVFVGKMRERHYAEAFEEYFKRLGAFGKPELREIAEERLPEQPSEKEIARALEREAAEIEKAVPKGACVVARDVEPGAGADAGRRDGCGGLKALLRRRRLLRAARAREEGGRFAALHVPDDLSAPPC